MISTELQRSNVNLDIVLKEVLSQLANLLRPGCTPHQSLPVGLLKTRGGKNAGFTLESTIRAVVYQNIIPNFTFFSCKTEL